MIVFRTAGLLVMCLCSILFSFNTMAQSTVCEGVLNLSPWLNAISSNFVDGGADGDEDSGYSLCSSAPGPDESLDSYRMLVQSAGGDFVIETTLTTLTAEGSGGLVVTLPGLNLASGARLLMWVESEATDATSGWLHSSLRRENSGQAEPEPAPLAVELPLRLRVTRTGGIVSTGFNDGDGDTVHLVADVTGEHLGGAIRTGMTQFSGDANTTRFATFERTTLVSATGPDIACVEGSAMLGNSPLVIKGSHMDSVTGISILGERAAILFQGSRSLEVQPGFTPLSGVNYGQLELSNAASRDPIRIEIAAIGIPFIRGDANLDGIVDASDVSALDRWMQRGVEPVCPGAGDVNGDSYTNAADVDALKAWLNGTGRAPAAPFPEPGYVEGAFTCGTPAAPGIQSAKMTTKGRKRPAKEGDVIELAGKDLPPAAEMVVWFGDVHTHTLSGSARSLRVRVDNVPADGRRCARIIHAQSQPAGEDLRIGGGWLADADSKKLCLDFSASPPGGPRFTSRETRDGTIEITIPRSDWQPGQAYSIDATVFMPWLDGVSRGSRALKMSFRAPTGAPDEYAHGLESLAEAMTSAMNGGFTPNPSNPCDCEVEVEPSPLAEKLILAPCLPPPPKPEPAVPGPDDLKKPNPIIVGGIIVKAKNPPPVECNGEFISHKEDARAAAWCHFEKIVQPVDENTYTPVFEPYIGHPLFASWKPLQMVMDTPYGGMDEPWILDPDSQPTGMKDILFDYETVSQLRDMEYNNPHVWALRVNQCINFENIWMPKISFGNRIVKTFFVAESMVPSSISLEGLYSYVPPVNEDNIPQERHYLLGLHIATSTLHDYGDQGQGKSFFWWATFWVPADDDDTETRSGENLEWTYSPTCTVGNGADRPVNLPPPWNRFVMCTDADPDEGPCGNPYAFGECPLDGTTTSCTGCHSDIGRRTIDGLGPLRLGWLPSLSLALSADELNTVIAETKDNPEDYTWWTEPALYDDDPKVPISCLSSSPTIWNPFDPDDLPPDEGEP
jgi:hypothetical protein